MAVSSSDPLGQPERRAELVAGLDRVRGRVAQSCGEAGRHPADITLIAVTKGFPASDIALLVELGVDDIGESRDQQARPKVEGLTAAGIRPRWHFVGQLQTNKARSVASYADAVHSVDRMSLVDALHDAAQKAGRILDAYLQVSLDADPARGGAVAADLSALAARVEAATALRLAGVMAVAPMGADPDVAFAQLAVVAAQVRAEHPRAIAVSAGMSDDLEAAIRHGATHLRVGSALLGRRTPDVG